MIKSFRGKLQHGDKVRIRLSTNNGLTGYKIKKFQIMPNNPTAETIENVTKIFAQDPVTTDAVINFDNPLLLAAAFYKNSNIANYSADSVIVFDNTVINQDIYVTAQGDTADVDIINYYIELEQVKLDLNEATVATLKDMRGRE